MSKKPKKPSKKETPREEDHPSQDKSSRFPIDYLLRRYNFKIYSRPRDKEELWEKNGCIFTQREALSTIDEDEVWGAEYEEYCYYYWIGLIEGCLEEDDLYEY